MDAQRDVEVVVDRRFRDHTGPPGHPERPERLSAVEDAIAQRSDELVQNAPRPAETEELLRIHDRSHVEQLQRAAESGPGQLDPDTYVSPASHDVARLAAGASIDLARRVARRDARCGFAAVRPPGHHAEADRAMGFCLFNNAAIAAKALQVEERIERILLLDWDVHHGNGTQHSFETDPSLLYFSTHQYPFYPGTGAFGEQGVGRGEGATLNVPLPAGCADAEYVGVLQRVLVPAAQAFRPDFVIVSCGFDAHADDPLAAMNVTGAGYAAMTAIVRQLASELCDERLLFVLEGGYSLIGLREGTDAVLGALLGPPPALPDRVSLAPNARLSAVLDRVAEVHGPRIGIG